MKRGRNEEWNGRTGGEGFAEIPTGAGLGHGLKWGQKWGPGGPVGGKLLSFQEVQTRALRSGRNGDREVIALPPSALQGIPERADELLAGLTPSINTVEDLASYKFYQIARAIVLLADMSGEGEAFDGGAGTKRPLNEEDTGFTGARANINKGLKRAFEGMSLREIADSDVSCLQGIAEDT
eukprot:gene18245-24698_t